MEEGKERSILFSCSGTGRTGNRRKPCIEIDRVCGEFLFSKKQSGQLNANNGFDVEMTIKQVQAGDTNVTFAVGEGSETLEAKLNTLISYLMNYGEGDFVCYRQIKW